MKIIVMQDEDVVEEELSPLQEYHRKVANGEIERSANKTPKQKWEENKKSLRASINYFCVQCLGNCSGVNNEIRNCTSLDCALYHVRPYK